MTIQEALERWHNSGGFDGSFEEDAADALYTLAAAFAAEHPVGGTIHLVRSRAMTPEELRNNVINDLLLCDECGRLHLDDTAALSESCDCGRFKQRMEWATVGQVLDTIERLERENAELRRDAERYRCWREGAELEIQQFNRTVLLRFPKYSGVDRREALDKITDFLQIDAALAAQPAE